MKKKKHLFRFFLKVFLILISSIALLIIVSNMVIVLHTRNFLFEQVSDIPRHKAGIVLGTSRNLKSGHPNTYFYHRMSAAAELYHSGNIDFLILSGDNRTIYYNEPEQMRRELVKYNISDTVLYLDYAGLRTLDSMIRSKEIFGQDSIVVISQKFHNQRAVFVARVNGIKAIGFNATDVSPGQGIRVQVREIFARVKVFLDIISGKKPRHLGEKINIGKTRSGISD
ncbi:MAG: SanA/YdcF family protein [Bacteroidota bacterium]